MLTMAKCVAVKTMRMPDQIPCLLDTIKDIRAEVSANGNENPKILLVVPQAFTLAFEQAIIFGLHERGFVGTRVFSPKTFAREVADLGGASELEPVTDFGEFMLFSQALTNLQKKGLLKYYESAAGQIGMPSKLSEQIKELTDAGYTPDTLREMAMDKSTPAGTASKYMDIALIWSEFNHLIENRFEDKSEQWNSVLRRVPLSGIFDDAHLIITGFAYLNKDITSLAAVANGCAKSVTVCLVCDETKDDAFVFSGAAMSLTNFKESLYSRNIGCASTVYTPTDYSYSGDPGVRYLEKMVFSASALAAGHAPDMQNVELYFARTSYAECLYAAQTLLKWHEEGTPWSDMGVACCERDTLPSLLPLVLKTANVPYTIREGQSILLNGYAQYFLASIQAACNGMRQEEMLKVIKSGFSGISEDEAMNLENYVIEHGVDKKRWLREFKARDPKLVDYVREMNALRERIVEPIVKLHDELASRSHTGRDVAELIYKHMVESGAYERLLEREQVLLAHDDVVAVDKNRQVWEMINDLLHQIATYAEGEHIRVEELADMVSAAMVNAEIKSIPQDVDSVQISDPNKFVSVEVKNLIVMGLQERENEGRTSLISEVERAALSEKAKTNVGFTQHDRASMAMLGIYQAISAAREKIMLSCSASKQDGGVMYPSSIYLRIEELVKAHHLENVHGGVESDEIEPIAPQIALEKFAIQLRAAKDLGANEFTGCTHPDWQQAFAYLCNYGDWAQKTKMMLSGLSAYVHSESITPARASILYPASSLSISRLESYAVCPFRHFVDYGLHPVVRRDYILESDAQGTFYHKVLQDYIRIASALPGWPNISDAEINRVLAEVIEKAMDAWVDGPLDADEAHRLIAFEIVSNVRRTAWGVTKSLQRGLFRPVGTEVEFGRTGSLAELEGRMHLPAVELELPSGRHIELNGKIDRVDTFTDAGGNRYFRVIDYKSSDRELRELSMAHGLQLQIPIYMAAVQRGMPGYAPAGGLYQHVFNPLVKKDDEIQDAIEDESVKQLQAKGMVLDDKMVQEAMGAVKMSKRSTSTVSLVDGPVMQAKIDGALSKAAELSDSIYCGNIAIAPVQDTQTSPCSYCKYASICGIDARLKGGKVKVLNR